MMLLSLRYLGGGAPSRFCCLCTLIQCNYGECSLNVYKASPTSLSYFTEIIWSKGQFCTDTKVNALQQALIFIHTLVFKSLMHAYTKRWTTDEKILMV